MPIFPEQAETAQNRDAMAGIGIPRVPSGSGNVNGEQIGQSTEQKMFGLDDAEWLQLTRQIKATGEQYLTGLRNVWANNYRAVNGQHLSGSKYTTERYRGRSQLHRPKTFSAVKKANAGAANALFATSDVVEVSSTNPGDVQSDASADINKHLLNIRLTDKSGKFGLPWFILAVGAHDDAKCTGICVSKQYWERKEKVYQDKFDEVPVLDEQQRPTFEAMIDETTGEPMIDPQTLAPMMGQVFEQVPKRKIVSDRPMSRLFSPDLVIRDPGADWLNQAQESAYIGLMHAMTIGDVKALAADPQNKTKAFLFRDVPEDQLLQARIGGATTPVVQARESSNTQNRLQTTTGITDFDRIWAIEWFVRFRGQEYVYWTAGSSAMLSDVYRVEDVYPEQNGERPIVIGLGNIQPHKIDPMSMVQSVMPLQQEMDDLANMRLDGVKESIRPLTFIVRGKNIDGRAIQARSGDTAVYVTSKDDVSFDRPQGPSMESYQELNQLTLDFDDTVGQFNNASVSSNRQLNETVGGMKLINANANIVGDFDLKVWMETWVDPVLRQLVRLEQYYEDDKVILMMAAEKAQLYKRYQISTITPELLAHELSVSVSAGIGNADPMVKLDKFAKVAGIAISLMGDQIKDRAKQDAIIDELFGAAGFRDASKRFFHEGDQTDQRIVTLQSHLQELQTQLEQNDAELENKTQNERIKSATQLVLKFLDGVQQERQAQQQAVVQAQNMGLQHAHDTKKIDKMGQQKIDQISAKPQPAGKGGKPAQAPAKPPAQAGQETEVKGELGEMSADFIRTMLPAIFSGGNMPMPVMPQPQVPMQQQAAPMQQAPGMDQQMLMQLLQSVMASQQQNAQAIAALAESMQQMAMAQMMPKTAKRAPDGTITMMPVPMPMGGQGGEVEQRFG